MDVNIGERFHERRLEKGWTLDDLAFRIRELHAGAKLSGSAIAKIEKGANARWSTLQKMAEALDLTLELSATGR